MARHWSMFVGGISEKQAVALDRMAEANGKGDGMDLLIAVSGCSRSKIGKMDRLSLRRFIDACFEEYGQEAVAKRVAEAVEKAAQFPPPPPAELTSGPTIEPAPERDGALIGYRCSRAAPCETRRDQDEAIATHPGDTTCALLPYDDGWGIHVNGAFVTVVGFCPWCGGRLA